MRIYCDSSTKEACFVVEGQAPIIAVYAEPVSNNVGEYKAVIIALEHAKDWGFIEVEILTDSQLVVNQVKTKEDGGWRCRAPHLLPLVTRGRKLAQEVGAIIGWVPREYNLAGKVLEKRGRKCQK